MIKCMIIDDEQHAVDLLISHIGMVPFLQLCHASTSIRDAIQFLNTGEKVDVLFLDIQMPEMTGIEFLKSLSERPNVILTTAYSEFAIEGFELEVTDYLLKPITFSRFSKSVNRLPQLLTKNKAPEPQTPEREVPQDYFFVKSEHKGKMIKIDMHEIELIEGMKNYVAIHRNNEKVLALMNMKFLEELLPRNRFIRVNNSFIVPIDRIQMVDGNQIAVKNSKARIPIGITYKNHVLEALKIKSGKST
jgi:two-component system LytT family response regulator